MKKITKILALTLVLIMLCMTTAFADESLKLVSAYPEDGQTGVALENFGVKLTFDGEFSESLKDANNNAFELVGSYQSGKDVVDNYSFPLKVLYSEDEPSEVLVLIDKDSDNKTFTLVGSKDYTFKIKKELVDVKGNTLPSDITMTFTTLNQQRNNLINTLMTFGMFGIIILVTMRSQKKNTEKEKTQKKEEAFNPYKEAKRTGKSVEEVIQEQERKEKKKKLKKEKKIEKVVNDPVIYLDPDEYYVTTLRAIPAESSDFVKAYKEAKENKRALEIERKKQLKAKKGKKK